MIDYKWKYIEEKAKNKQYRRFLRRLKHKLKKIVDFNNLYSDPFDLETSEAYDKSSKALNEIEKIEKEQNE